MAWNEGELHWEYFEKKNNNYVCDFVYAGAFVCQIKSWPLREFERSFG